MGDKGGLLSKVFSSICDKYKGTETAPCELPAPQSVGYQPKYPEAH